MKKGDKVIVITGKNKKKSGEIKKVFPKTGKVLVSGINLKKRHRKPTRAGSKGNIVDVEFPIHISNLKLQ